LQIAEAYGVKAFPRPVNGELEKAIKCKLKCSYSNRCSYYNEDVYPFVAPELGLKDMVGHDYLWRPKPIFTDNSNSTSQHLYFSYCRKQARGVIQDHSPFRSRNFNIESITVGIKFFQNLIYPE